MVSHCKYTLYPLIIGEVIKHVSICENLHNHGKQIGIRMVFTFWDIMNKVCMFFVMKQFATYSGLQNISRVFQSNYW